MKKRYNPLNLILPLTLVCIVLPILLVAMWAVARRWPWPMLLPQGISLRGAKELFGGYSNAMEVLLSSMALSMAAAAISVIIGLMSARAFALYDFYGKAFLRFGSMLPIIIPANVFAMGIHVIFLRRGLGDSLLGVLICHVIYSIPYTINILTNITEAVGLKYEQQSSLLGVGPVRSFVAVTLPLILPAVMSSFSMAYIISFSQYFLTLLIGGGKVKTFSLIMVPFISGGDRTIAASYALVFMLSSMLVFVVFEYIAKKLVRGNSK